MHPLSLLSNWPVCRVATRPFLLATLVAAGFGLLTLLHRDLQTMAETWIAHFHLNPASRYPRIFLSLAARIGDTQLWLLAAGAAAYASVRLAEAYGLWRDRAWASWLGALSGAIYVPIELFELVERITALRMITFAINVAIDPHTARVVGRRVFYHAWNPLRHCFVGFFFKLHYELAAGETGVLVVGIMACALVISALTGLILWWPLDGKWRRVLTIRRRAHVARFNHDLHQASGFYLLPVLLALLVTGLYFNLPDQYRWMVERFATLAPEPAAASAAVTPVAPTPAAEAPATRDVDALLQDVARQYPGGTLGYLTLTDRTTGLFTACYDAVPALRARIVDGRCLDIERASGRVVQVTDTAHGSAGDVFMQWQWPLHSGRAFGWTGRILVGLCGLVCPLLFVTGLIRWLQKRRAAAFALRRSPSRGDA